MGLLSILKKLKQKEKEVRLLMLGVAQPFIIVFSNRQCFGSGSVAAFHLLRIRIRLFTLMLIWIRIRLFTSDAGKSRLGIDCQSL
jgi:hypothetical protein